MTSLRLAESTWPTCLERLETDAAGHGGAPERLSHPDSVAHDERRLKIKEF